jgi:hypothetical protein
LKRDLQRLPTAWRRCVGAGRAAWWRTLGLCSAGSAAGGASAVARQRVGQLDPGDLVGWPWCAGRRAG